MHFCNAGRIPFWIWKWASEATFYTVKFIQIKFISFQIILITQIIQVDAATEAARFMTLHNVYRYDCLKSSS
jgi:hypothetical protein